LMAGGLLQVNTAYCASAGTAKEQHKTATAGSERGVDAAGKRWAAEAWAWSTAPGTGASNARWR
jgi:hypothetical protein